MDDFYILIAYTLFEYPFYFGAFCLFLPLYVLVLEIPKFDPGYFICNFLFAYICLSSFVICIDGVVCAMDILTFTCRVSMHLRV